jgi:hypothetical protein
MHMKEEARQTAAWEADLPTIFHKPWQLENPDFLLGRQTDKSTTIAPPSALPKNCGIPFRTLPKFLTSVIIHLHSRLPSSWGVHPP